MKILEKYCRIFGFGFYATFTLNGFDDQERSLRLVKTDFQVLKPKYHACHFKQTFYPLHKLNIAWPSTTQKYIYTRLIVRYLIVKPVWVNAALVTSILFQWFEFGQA